MNIFFYITPYILFTCVIQFIYDTRILFYQILQIFYFFTYIYFYTHHKSQLLDRLNVSGEHRITQLLYHVQMGDRSPSDFYRYMVQLAGDSTNLTTVLIRKLWLSMLPKTIEISLIAIGSRDIGELLKVADRLWEATQAGAISSIAGPSFKETSGGNPANEMNTLRQEIAELRDMLKTISVQPDRNNRGRQRNRSSSGSRSRTPSQVRKHPMCYFHFRFGDQARRCQKPCNFSQQKN